jgi:membrane protease YdiL (CAAX protease family)
VSPRGGFVQRHPVLSFYALAFGISAGGMLAVIGASGQAAGTLDPLGPVFLLMMLAWFAGPSLGGVVMTGLASGRAGYRDLLARSVRWRVGLRWYAVGLLVAPVVSTILSLALSVPFPQLLPNIVTSSDKGAVLLMGVAYGFIGGGLLEELGWTGFAVPRLLPRYGVLGTGLIAGLLWGAYHFSIIYWAGNPSGLLPMAILAAQLFAWMPAFRVLMVWVYDRTGSLLVAMLIHGSLSASMFIFQSITMSGVAQLVWLVVFGATWWLAVAAVAVATRGHVARVWVSP